MNLITGMAVFVLENYLKVFTILLPTCSLWQYYNTERHVYVTVLELLLMASVVGISFALLALTKMDCNRLANYFSLPVFLALLYMNLSRKTVHGTPSPSPGSAWNEMSSPSSAAPPASSATTPAPIQASSSSSSSSSATANDLAETLELGASNGLGALVCVLVAVNLFVGRHRLAKILIQ